MSLNSTGVCGRNTRNESVMPSTNFPNGISNGGTAVNYGVTSVAAGAGTVTTNLDTVVGVVPSIAGVPGTAASSVLTVAGTAHVNATGASTFILRTYRADGSAGTATVSVAWHAFGTRA